ncbi:hypothetical protein BDN72DRAFT_836878 [Pluteus cervinus]|uniref:Uncharacterized protein n=1 Tax=Pluteus cervinus TaxID=181527 RepID=A0ACD3B2Y0_9AGAR|nr:hypothetical protein BDN72DRAFT_836878 [Pluteus cervinus]
MEARNYIIQHLDETLPSMRLPSGSGPNTYKKAGTRPPAHFDTHLADNLILQRVAPFLDLTQTLESITNTKLDEVDWPSIGDYDLKIGAPPPEGPEMISETAVRTYYYKHASPRAHRIANLLLTETKQSPLLSWTLEPGDSTSAVADGFLRVAAKCSSAWPADIKADHMLWSSQPGVKPVIAVWEFKKPAAAGQDVLTEITNFFSAERFPWYRCAGPTDPACNYRGGHKDGHMVHTYQHVSPDMVQPEFSDYIRENTTRHEGPPELSGLREFRHETAKEKALWILQQAWSEAVQEDATFMVLNFGNSELIGYRHRESQTLFLSHTYHNVFDPNYIRIHVGLSIAGYNDFIKRMEALSVALMSTRTPQMTDKQWERMASARRLWEGPSADPSSKVATAVLKSGRLHDAVLRSLSSLRVKLTMNPWAEMRALEWKRYNFLPRFVQSPVPSWESMVHPVLPIRFRTEDWQLCVEQSKSRQCGWWSSAKLLEKKTEAQLPLCARVALDAPTAEMFYVQYSNYWYLRALGLAQNVLVEHYTYFMYEHEAALSAVLVTAPPGTPLKLHCRGIDRFLRATFEAKLQAIHNLGFLHNSIVPQNLYVYNSVNGFIDGLNLMVECPPGEYGAGKKRKEMKALMDILDGHSPHAQTNAIYQGLGSEVVVEAHEPAP